MKGKNALAIFAVDKFPVIIRALGRTLGCIYYGVHCTLG